MSNACDKCGRRFKGSKQEKYKLSQELCSLMGWSESDAWKVRNVAMRQDKLQDLINKIKAPTPTNKPELKGER